VSLIQNHFSAIVISVAVVITGIFLGKSFKDKGKPDPVISVTGLGEKSFDSDLIVWRANFSRRNFELKSAYNELNKDINAVKRYLKSKGISEKDVVFEAADIQKDYSYFYDNAGRVSQSIFNGYVLTQNMKVQSKNVDLVEKTSREVSQLIDAGIELNSYSPEYYYTKLTELKLKMIEEATKDAYDRAQKIAENGGGKIKKMMQADMGVFQIIAENSSEEYNWGGSFNTTSRRKTANITMRLKYLVD
jgi:hypothetical protein